MSLTVASKLALLALIAAKPAIADDFSYVQGEISSAGGIDNYIKNGGNLFDRKSWDKLNAGIRSGQLRWIELGVKFYVHSDGAFSEQLNASFLKALEKNQKGALQGIIQTAENLSADEKLAHLCTLDGNTPKKRKSRIDTIEALAKSGSHSAFLEKCKAAVLSKP